MSSLRSPMRKSTEDMLRYLAWAAEFRAERGLTEWVDTRSICEQFVGSAKRPTVRYRLHSLVRRGLMEKIAGIAPDPSVWRVTQCGLEAAARG